MTTQPQLGAETQREVVDFIWQGLLDKDDRTSPEGLTDMLLITKDEIASIVAEVAGMTHERGYKEGWNDREGDLIAGVQRIAPEPGVKVDREGASRDLSPTDDGGDQCRSAPWQPIETAPRDGSLIDVWCPEIGRFADVQWETLCEDFARKCTIEGEPGWTYYPNSPPTHWMPLPTPPASGEDGTSARQPEPREAQNTLQSEGEH